MDKKLRHDFGARTGLCIRNLNVLSCILPDRPYDRTDLIRTLQQRERNVGGYPVSGESWIDVGQWDEYRKAVEQNKFCVTDEAIYV